MAETGKISEFAQQFGQGVRPTLFRVWGDFVVGTGTQPSPEKQEFFIKSAQLPSSTIGMIEVPYKGRKIKRPGDRTFAEWTVTVLASDDFPIRSAFLDWMHQINHHVNVHTGYDHSNQATDWNVEAIKPDGNPHTNSHYVFVNCFPTEVGVIEMNYETVDTIAEFPVTIQFDYWYGGGVNAGVGD